MGVGVLNPTPTTAAAAARARAAAVPWHIVAVLFASTSIVVGVIWDISWHISIGRDTFWTPAHIAMYVGGVVAGVASGFLVLKTTFAGTAEEKASSVRFWGFRGPLGAWVSIWGAFAMLTSAPLDDWWHNAYGLDVEILSPPHVVLAAGMIAVAVGAMIYVLALQNRGEQRVRSSPYPVLLAYASGIVLCFVAIMVYEYCDRVLQHSSIFYKVACLAFPVILVAFSRASKLRWAATGTALGYSMVTLVMTWVLPLFPAQAKLGPIYQNITHMVPMDFPLLLVAPALVMDLAARRAPVGRDWRMSVVYGVIFFVVFLVAQFSFAYFLMSPSSMNWFFATDNFPYSVPTTWYGYRREFYPSDASEGAMRAQLGVALALAIVSSRVGLWWGNWLRQVRR